MEFCFTFLLTISKQAPKNTETQPRDGGQKPQISRTYGKPEWVSETLADWLTLCWLCHSSRTAQESLSFQIQRFLKDRDDEILLHQEQPSQGSSRSDRLQAVIDGVERLGLSRKDAESKQDK